MPRVYLPADARCRQIERIVRARPGVTGSELALELNMAPRSMRAYLRRLVREERVVVQVEAPSTPRGCLQRFYPPKAAEPAKIAA